MHSGEASRAVYGGPAGGNGGGNRRAPSLAGVRLVTKRTGSASYLSQKITVVLNALCGLLRHAHAVAAVTVLWPTPEVYDAELRVERAYDGSRDGSGVGGDDHDRRRGGEDSDRPGGGSGSKNRGGSGHSSRGGGNRRRTGTTHRGKGGGNSKYSWGEFGPPAFEETCWQLHLGPTLRPFGEGGHWCVSPGRQGGEAL